MTNRPSDYIMPAGWSWERIEQERAKWGIADNMVPIGSVPGAAVAWGTLNSYRHDSITAKIAFAIDKLKTASCEESRKAWFNEAQRLRDCRAAI